MTGPESSSMALRAASLGAALLDVTLHAFDDDDGMRSTTRPMANTSPNIERVLMEKPEQREQSKRAYQRDRHGRHRDQGSAPVLAGDVTTRRTSTMAIKD